jgi:hypothetical protein
MGIYLLIILIFGLILSLLVLFLIFIKERIFDFQKIWNLAAGGNKLAIVYFLMVMMSFLLSVVSVIFMRMGS